MEEYESLSMSEDYLEFLTMHKEYLSMLGYSVQKAYDEKVLFNVYLEEVYA